MSKLEVREIGPISGETEVRLAEGATAVGFGGGAGSIIQTVLGTNDVFMTTNSIDWVETGLEATITPTKASSKILVTWNIQACIRNNGGYSTGLTRNGQDVWNNTYNAGTYGNGITDLYSYQGPFIFIDEPNTTNSLNYKTLVWPHVSDLIKLNGFDANSNVETQILLQEIAG